MTETLTFTLGTDHPVATVELTSSTVDELRLLVDTISLHPEIFAYGIAEWEPSKHVHAIAISPTTSIMVTPVPGVAVTRDDLLTELTSQATLDLLALELDKRYGDSLYTLMVESDTPGQPHTVATGTIATIANILDNFAPESTRFCTPRDDSTWTYYNGEEEPIAPLFTPARISEYARHIFGTAYLMPYAKEN